MKKPEKKDFGGSMGFELVAFALALQLHSHVTFSSAKNTILQIILDCKMNGIKNLDVAKANFYSLKVAD